ncbi:hypothetical protein M0805_008841 [Coniferiporia weirii]|nr:hypothetical protein M0805_008841 [Coniferiporia weirii]
MACTPRKLVHWSGENEVNEFVYGSPYSDASSSDSVNASSTLQYINSQLVAHGFARGTGVSFEGLSKEDADRLAKCMLGMLSQRMEDMARAEDLSTKLRTLSYEHERLSSMHRTTVEQLASSERETSGFKSRLAASTKSLQNADAAHKLTSAELQRTRSSLQSVRQTHAAELKRREKETEKMIERWQKISDAQTKLGATAAGLRFKFTHANPVVSSRDSDIIGKTPGLLEDALDEANMARKELVEENTSLKNVVLSAANELARLSHAARQRIEASEDDEVLRYTFSDIFTISAPESASEKFNALLSTFRESLTRLGGNYEPESTTPPGLPPAQPNTRIAQTLDSDGQRDDSKRVQMLQNTIVDLRKQLEQIQTQNQTSNYADEAQAIIRRFVNDADDKAHIHERQILEKIRKELDHARKKVDEAALTLRDEKGMLEDERQAFLREQRLWRSQMCIPQDEEGPKPITGLGAYFDAPAEPLEIPLSPPRPSRKGKKLKSPKKPVASPRKPLVKSTAAPRSPAKSVFAVGKMSKKASRSGGGTPRKLNGTMLGASTLRPKVIPPMETEVITSAPMLSTTASSQSLIVPNSFVLPPPSPLTSIPPQPDLLSSLKPMAAPSFDEALAAAEESLTATQDQQESEQSPGTPPPTRRPFPVAKPFAQHMIHAYSPARPSPLSRILLLANSPAQSVSASEDESDTSPPQFETEGGAGDEMGGSSGTNGSSGSGEGVGRMRAMTLEEELGIEELTSASDESPLREKNIRQAGKSRYGKSNAARSGNSVRERGKARMGSTKTVGSKPAKPETDKENGSSKPGKPPPQPPALVVKPAVPSLKLLGPSGKGGARRVPIGSADAAPIGPGWK